MMHDRRIDPHLMAAAHQAAADALPRSRQLDPREVAMMPYAQRQAYEQARRSNVEHRHHHGEFATAAAAAAAERARDEAMIAGRGPRMWLGGQTEISGAMRGPADGMGWQSELSGALPHGPSGLGWPQDISMGSHHTGYSPTGWPGRAHHRGIPHARGRGWAPGAGASSEEVREGVAGLPLGYMPMISPTVSMTPPGSAPITSPAPASPAPTPWYEPAVMLWGEFVDWAKGIL